jgi:hypothetical protein
VLPLQPADLTGTQPAVKGERRSDVGEDPIRLRPSGGLEGPKKNCIRPSEWTRTTSRERRPVGSQRRHCQRERFVARWSDSASNSSVEAISIPIARELWRGVAQERRGFCNRRALAAEQEPR